LRYENFVASLQWTFGIPASLGTMKRKTEKWPCAFGALDWMDSFAHCRTFAVGYFVFLLHFCLFIPVLKSIYVAHSKAALKFLEGGKLAMAIGHHQLVSHSKVETKFTI
jgi:hypothetical protein